jgi:hypothetical protein
MSVSGTETVEQKFDAIRQRLIGGYLSIGQDSVVGQTSTILSESDLRTHYNKLHEERDIDGYEFVLISNQIKCNFFRKYIKD